MEHSQGDPATDARNARRSDNRPDQSVTVVEPVPSMSGTHWANRDNDTLYRRPGGSRPFADDSPAPVDTSARHWTTIGTAARPTGGQSGAEAAPKGNGGSGLVAEVRPQDDLKGRAAARKARQAKRTQHAAPDPDETIGVLGPGREIRPHRAVRPQPGSGADKDTRSRGTATAASRRPRAGFWAILTTVFLVLVGGAAAVAVFTDKADKLTSVLGGVVGLDGQRTVTAALDGRTEASFELVTGTNQVILRSDDLGDDLYRITSAADSGSVPRPVVDENRVQLHLTPEGDGTSGTVEIVLAAKVTWALRFAGGADDQRIDMRRGRVGGIDVVGGTRRMELNLPVPTGTVVVRITGAVDEFVMTSPKDNPVRMKLDSGAKTVVAGERTRRDVPPGSTFTPRNWKVDNRYDVDVAARVTLLSVVPAN